MSGLFQRGLVLAVAVAALVWLAISLSDVRALNEARGIVSSPDRSPRQIARGLRLVDRAGRLDPAAGDRLLVKAQLLTVAGHRGEAQGVLDELVRREPKNVAGWIELAVLTYRRDSALSRAAAARVRALDPVRPRPR